jgi:hypothetical protein
MSEHDCNRADEFGKINGSLRTLDSSHKILDKKLDAVLDSVQKMADMQQEALLSNNSHRKDIEQIRQMIDEFKKQVEKINEIQFGKHTDAHQRLDEVEKFIAVYDEMHVKDNVNTLWADRLKASGVRAWKAEIYGAITIGILILKTVWDKIEFVPKTP